jgi:hypothetical protein
LLTPQANQPWRYQQVAVEDAGIDHAVAARRAGFEDDGALLGERLEMVLGGIWRGETEGAGNFHARRWRAEHFQRAFDEVENFLLTWREFHGRPPLKTNDCIFVQ